MKLTTSGKGDKMSFYVAKSIRVDGKSTTKTVEKLGNAEYIKNTYNVDDPKQWAIEYVKQLNEKEAKAKHKEIIKKLSPNTLIDKNIQTTYNGGYLFLENIYYQLGLNKVCNKIMSKYKIEYDLNNILSNLIYTRILFPSSKLKSYQLASKFIEQPTFDQHQMYRALEYITKESDLIESEVYKNSSNVIDRNTKILYYDCTNYFFEIEEEDDFRKYAKSKENRPNPIVQMGLFLDGNGLPLAFCTTPGNQNEQTTLKPLEKRIIKDFELSDFVVCTDAGLASAANRKFNNIGNRSYIVTQSIKKLKSHLQDWIFDNDDWYMLQDNKKIKVNLENINIYNNKNIYFKERWINENGLEQRLIVSFSPKHKLYQSSIRNRQLERAKKIVEKPSSKTTNQNSPTRFIEDQYLTEYGEVASITSSKVNYDKVEKEEKYDGYYAVCTTLDNSIEEIIEINKQRWKIEDCFRLLKTEFKARPVYLSKEERIKAHFTICFLSLLIFRIMELKLEKEYTACNILETLKKFDFYKEPGEGYIPLYTRTDLTDKLHETFGFRTDYEIVVNKELKKILKKIKR